MDIFNIVWPVIAIFVAGFTAQRFLNIELASLSTFTIYLLVPFLAFRTFYQEGIDKEIVYYAVFVGALCLLLVLVGYCFSYFWNKDKEKHYGFILSSAFMNNGNFGVPLVLAIFGDQALNIAVMLMVLQQLLMSSVGVYFAAKGSPIEAAKGWSVIWKVLKLPLLYAALLGFIFNITSITLPKEMTGSINSIADAAIPVIMLLLGMQLANISFVHINVSRMISAVLVRLIISPAVAWLLVVLLPVNTLTGNIMIVMAAAPSAANTTLYAVQFQTDPHHVSAVTLITTLSSIFTIPLLLLLLI